MHKVTEGAVRAPAAERVLQVPLTAGSVVLPGDTIAQVAEANFVLRLGVPERHARFLRAGDKVRLDGWRHRLQRPLLFGLVSSTLLTVLVIPAIYVVLRATPTACCDGRR